MVINLLTTFGVGLSTYVCVVGVIDFDAVKWIVGLFFLLATILFKSTSMLTQMRVELSTQSKSLDQLTKDIKHITNKLSSLKCRPGDCDEE